MNEKLVKIATEAGLSPTFVNWFSDHPEQALGELWRWWSLKGEIIEFVENYSKNDQGKIVDGTLLEKIKNQNFMKEELF